MGMSAKLVSLTSLLCSLETQSLRNGRVPAKWVQDVERSSSRLTEGQSSACIGE